ncbi:amidohydrolase/deacetylase family metallohydrolase [Enterococcus casseliflavus]|uniref:amidohydrolase/deacetylase family metallohydrolase n=1 Tax=Enterococcus casseliflavus TaxID=37734 RepID=UPI0039A6EF68
MFDLIIRQARTIDEEVFDIGIQDGKITALAPTLQEQAKQELTLAEGEFLSAGWIDDHVHCFEEMTLYYDYPDEIGVKQGVTTVIDAGTTGAENIHRFYDLAKDAKTNVFALVNISKWGIVEQDELADLSKVKKELVKEALQKFPDFIVGIKARMSKTVIGENGITPLKLAKTIQAENQPLPLMVHIGSAPPNLAEILAELETGDVVTHCFNGKANGFLDQTNQTIKPFVFDAYEKGLVFDIGHGTDSFNFDVAETAFANQLKASSISTDIYIRNRTNGPVFDLATTMEKLAVVGYDWREIIEKVTSAPAKQFHLQNKGEIALGYDADFTIFRFEAGEKELTDSNGNRRITTQQIVPQKAVIGGELFDTEY